MRQFKYIDDLVKKHPQSCAHADCMLAGEHRAPLSPEQPNNYQFFCLEHIKEFNKRWDYFKGKSSQEIESFQKDAFTGHRPTWRMGSGNTNPAEKLQYAFSTFMGHEELKEAVAQTIAPKDHQALAVMGLDHPSDTVMVKKHYKKLVKRYHPDRNPGDKQAEERFKAITAAYRHLIDAYCPTISDA